MRLVLLILGAVLTLYLAVLAWLWFRQERLMFFPEPLAADARLASEPDVHELAIDVPGARLSALQLRLPDPKGVVFFLHGNAGNLQGWFTNAAFYREANYDLVMLDYRGYGKSTGRIESEAQMHEDVRALWRSVAPRYQGRKVVVYGRSLGTALAANLAADFTAAGRAPDLTVLVSPYTSMADLAHEFYPWIPSLVHRYKLDTLGRLQAVKGPVLIAHGEKDSLIGTHHAKKLAEAAPNARLLIVPGAAHNDIHEFPAYRDGFMQALRSL